MTGREATQCCNFSCSKLYLIKKQSKFQSRLYYFTQQKISDYIKGNIKVLWILLFFSRVESRVRMNECYKKEKGRGIIWYCRWRMISLKDDIMRGLMIDCIVDVELKYINFRRIPFWRKILSKNNRTNENKST